MPTGYTSDLYEGKDIEFPQFVMKCARAMGALVEFREEPLDAPIPEEIKPSTYHAESLQKAKAVMTGIEAWDESEADRQAQLAYERAERGYQEAFADRAAMRKRYETMLAKVNGWAPPSSNHEGLKKFMVEQLEQSIKFDCGTDYLTPPQRLSGADYKEEQLASARRDITYHTEHGEADIRRAAERTEWIRTLRQSLAESSDTALEV